MRRFWFAWLAFALVAAQGLGLMHGVAHRPHVEVAAVAQGAAQYAEQAGPAASDHGWIAHLFGHDDDDAGCRLFDPLNHEAAPLPLATPAPLVFSRFFLLTCQGEFLARWVALFDARGPPSSVR